MICLHEVHKFVAGHFLTICIFYVLILNIVNQKFSPLIFMSYIFTLLRPTTSAPNANPGRMGFAHAIEMNFAQPDNPCSFTWK